MAPYLPKLLTSGLKHEAVAMMFMGKYGNNHWKLVFGEASQPRDMKCQGFLCKDSLISHSQPLERGTVLTHIFSLHLGKLRQGDQAK